MVEEGSTSNVRRRYKKITQADLIGKTAGRWTRQEHLRFIQGKVLIQIFYFVQLLKSMARIGKKLKMNGFPWVFPVKGTRAKKR